MNEITALLDQNRYIRKRFLGFLDEISASPYSGEALHWSMPFGKGRAHIAWQFMHCAATYDRYLYFRILNMEPKFPDLVKAYGNGSVPNAKLIVSPETIRTTLNLTTTPFYEYYGTLSIEQFSLKPHEGADRTHKEILELLNWHEASHMGQSQIIWNSFRATKGIIE